MARCRQQTFSDGSSITVLENGTIIVRETKSAKHELLHLGEPTPISYDQPPPPPPSSKSRKPSH